MHSDPLLLERIVGNLVANAVRYTRSGAVLLACRRSGANLRIGVWDTGIGIAPDKLERIFDEFYRVEATAGESGDGLGLGLSIVARLTDLLSHPVEVRSAPGRGSCFCITVPQGMRQITAPARGAAQLAGVLEGRSVLVVDNNDAVLKSTADLLKGWGCRVHSLTGLSPEDPAPATDVELVLVDMRLDNGDDGVSVVSRLRKRLGRDVPALVMTGDVSVTTREHIAQAGLPMLEKPISALRLRSALTRLLQRA